MSKNVVALVCAFAFFFSPTTGQEKKKIDKKAEVEKLWKIADKAYKKDDEKLSPSVKIDQDGSIEIANRGMLITKEKVGPGTLSLSWKWTEGDDASGQYCDHFVIVLGSSDGKQSGAWSHEILNGTVIRCNPRASGVTIVHVKDGEVNSDIERGNFDFNKGSEYGIKVVDTGKEVSFEIDGKVIVKSAKPETPGFACIYNRESVADTRMLSNVSKLEWVMAQAKKKK
jgi:hypothetical protein